MSEQAKLAYLQEKIKDAKGHERGGMIVFVIGVFVTAIGFGLNPLIGSNAGIPMEVGGLILAVIGSFRWFYYGYQNNKLMEQLRTLANVMPTCPNCGKAIPQGNYAFCPFCGTSLKP